jgi:predicted AAA+ superfamily ATPase
MNGQIINLQNIARESGVARSTAETYFAILEDTLLGHFLPAWRPRLKVREAAHPKFYWFDPGVARAAAGWLRDPADRLWQGNALETLVFHEIRVYNEAARKHRPVAYYRTPAGVEVDFVIEASRRSAGETAEVIAIEVKRAEKWSREWEGPLRSLEKFRGIQLKKRIGVYTGKRSYVLDGVEILPVEEFFDALHEGRVF